MINIKNTLLLSWLFASVGLSAQTLKIATEWQEKFFHLSSNMS